MLAAFWFLICSLEIWNCIQNAMFSILLNLLLQVPFLDICNTLLDSTLPLTILDYEEFGNPQIESYFKYIVKYSPYDNVSHELCFPATLVTASYNDSR